METRSQEVAFVKMSGAGNDFLLLELAEPISPPAIWIRRVCERQQGVGADGVLLCGAKTAPREFWLRVFNSDGGRAAMCGNGLRCAALYLARARSLKADQKFSLDLQFSHHLAQVSSAGVPDVQIRVPPSCRSVRVLADQRSFQGHLIDTGVPHFVVSLAGISGSRPTLRDLPLRKWGPLLRHRDSWRDFNLENGANVTFVDRLDLHKLAIRTFERGVEDETLACGTGAAAASWAFGDLVASGPACSVQFLSGESAQMTLRGGSPLQLWQSGPARAIFQGLVPSPFRALSTWHPRPREL